MNFDPENLNQSSATDLVRNLPEIRRRLAQAPVQITSHGRKEFVLLSQAHFQDMSNLVTTDVNRLDSKLTLVLDSIETMVVITDENLNVRRANRAFCDHTGREQSQLVGSNLAESVDNPNQNFVVVRMRAVWESKIAESFEIPALIRPGRLLQCQIKPWPKGIALFASDITERHNAAELATRDFALSNAFTAVGKMGSAIIDRFGRIQRSFDSLANLLSTSRQNLDNVSVFSFLGPNDRTKIESYIGGDSIETFSAAVSVLQQGQDYAPAILALSPYATNLSGPLFAMVLRFDI